MSLTKRILIVALLGSTALLLGTYLFLPEWFPMIVTTTLFTGIFGCITFTFYRIAQSLFAEQAENAEKHRLFMANSKQFRENIQRESAEFSSSIEEMTQSFQRIRAEQEELSKDFKAIAEEQKIIDAEQDLIARQHREIAKQHEQIAQEHQEIRQGFQQIAQEHQEIRQEHQEIRQEHQEIRQEHQEIARQQAANAAERAQNMALLRQADEKLQAWIARRRGNIRFIERLTLFLGTITTNNRPPVEWQNSQAETLLANRAPASALESLRCPITQEVMDDPVEADGHIYERWALQAWFDDGHHTSPLTRAPLTDPSQLPTHAETQSAIQALIQQYANSNTPEETTPENTTGTPTI